METSSRLSRLNRLNIFWDDWDDRDDPDDYMETRLYRVNMSLHFRLLMTRSAIIPFAREEHPETS